MKNIFFIFHVTKDMKNDQFNKHHELKKANNQKFICGKLMSQFNHLIFMSMFAHTIRSQNFHAHLKREFLKSNVSFESGLKNHFPLIPTLLEIQ
jgi:hypothetical protein